MQGSAISYASLTARGLAPNRWDIIAFPLVFGLLLLAAKGAHETLAPLSALKEPVVSLDPVKEGLNKRAEAWIWTWGFAHSRRDRAIWAALMPHCNVLQGLPD